VGRAEVALAFGGDDTLRGFNRRYRGVDRATDVLSFLYEDETKDGVRRLAGDLVVSVPRVLAQARRYRVTPGRELARLVVHGALHLCGHDHVQVGERRRMRERERVHLRALPAAWEHSLTRLVAGWAGRVE
jgi:probable rRNA maturation factor